MTEGESSSGSKAAHPSGESLGRKASSKASGGERPRRRGGGGDSKKAAPAPVPVPSAAEKMGVDAFAKMSLGGGNDSAAPAVVSVSVGNGTHRSALKGGVPAPNAIPSAVPAPKQPTVGRQTKESSKESAKEQRSPNAAAANAAAAQKKRSSRGGKGRKKEGGGPGGGQADHPGADDPAPPEPRGDAGTEEGAKKKSSRGGKKKRTGEESSDAGGEKGDGTDVPVPTSRGNSEGAKRESTGPPRAVPSPRRSDASTEPGAAAELVPSSPPPPPRPKASKRKDAAAEEKAKAATDPAKADAKAPPPAGAYVPPSRRKDANARDEDAGGHPTPGAPKEGEGRRGRRKKEKGASGDDAAAGSEPGSTSSSKAPKKDKKDGKDGQAAANAAGTPPNANSAGKSQAGKEIRRHVEAGNVDAAMATFEERAKFGQVDVDTARALLQGLARACHLHEAIVVAEYLKERKMKMPLRHFTSVVISLSQRANPMDALDLMNALEQCVAYETRAIHNYHQHFVKLIVREFLEEALQTLDRVANAPAFGLQESGLAAMDVIVRGGGKGGSLGLDIPALGEELKRGLMKGDTVLLSRTGEAARSMGDAAEMPTGPRGGPIEMPTGPRLASADGGGDSGRVGRGGRAGGGWRADYEFEAEISGAFPNVSARLIGCNPKQAASVRGGGWRVDKLANRTSFLRQLSALQDMLEVKQGTAQKAGVDPAIRDVLVAGWDGNKADKDAVPDMCAAERHKNLGVIARQKMIDQAMDLRAMSHMNKSQTDALEAALFQRVTLIQGPPGTGKTHTAVALVQMWLRNRTCPILCTSDSNIAVDNLVDGLSRAGVRVARIGRPEAVRQDLMQYMVESIAGIEPGCSWSKDQQYQAVNGVLRRAEVICATCAGAGSDILERFSFQACLIDEATQATEPATVVPLTKGCSQVVLIGDQKQLPPTIISRDADAAGLGTSLFERMLARGIRAFMLKVQYRMHPAIASFPSKAFYSDELLSGTPPSARRAPMGFDWPVPAVPLAFVDVPDGYERSDGSSQTNPVEAQKIVNVVKKLVQGHDVLPADIGIVTPYAAQVRAINRLLHGNRRPRSRFDAPPAPDSLEALEVSTVDGFQGREKEVIVFTCTRANPNGNVGFLADPRRVNVMLTRARRGLIVVGHIPTLRREPTVWGPWLTWATENGLVCGAAATDADSAARLATIGMSSLDEIGGRGAGEVMQMGALLSPMMGAWGNGGNAGDRGEGADEGPKLKERAFIPDAWDDSDSESDGEGTSEGLTTETESATIKGSTNSLAGMADGAWGESEGEGEE